MPWWGFALIGLGLLWLYRQYEARNYPGQLPPPVSTTFYKGASISVYQSGATFMTIITMPDGSMVQGTSGTAATAQAALTAAQQYVDAHPFGTPPGPPIPVPGPQNVAPFALNAPMPKVSLVQTNSTQQLNQLVGDTIDVTLPYVPASGQSWRPTLTDPVTGSATPPIGGWPLTLYGSMTPGLDPNSGQPSATPGAAQSITFGFLATQPGITRIYVPLVNADGSSGGAAFWVTVVVTTPIAAAKK
jgi:hypothetical protein